MSLERIMNARSVAVIGASKDETKRGFQAIKTLQQEKFEGKIYPISLREKKILGLPCYPNINDVEDDVDLALITTPAKTIATVLTDCGQKGVAGAVIIAGGFREQDFDGRIMDRKNRGKIQYPADRSQYVRNDQCAHLPQSGGIERRAQGQHRPYYPKRQHCLAFNHRGQIEKSKRLFLLRWRGQ